MTNKLILIDPFEQTVSFVESDGKIESLKALMKCDLIDVVSVGVDNVMVLDDNGLLKENRYFTLMGQPYAGRAVIMTEDKDQNMIDSDLDLERVKERITWHPEGFKVEPKMQFVPLP